MTVKELIERLSTMPMNADVYVDDHEENMVAPVLRLYGVDDTDEPFVLISHE